jgi:hypothetical protein
LSASTGVGTVTINIFDSAISFKEAVKNELKLLKMPNNINTIDDFIQKFNEEEN